MEGGAELKKYLFAELFEKYRLPLFRYLMQMSRNRETAEELLQETFYRAMISLKVKNMVQAKAWLFKVARNLYIDQARKSESENKMIEKLKKDYQPSSKLGNPQQQLESKNRQEELEHILAKLPERMQTIIYLREIQGFSYKELATAMDLSDSQVKTTLHRARQKFQQYEQERRELENEKR
ncbi:MULTISPECIES: RNA polymerase sigma factor [Sediminibacillus]|uniref:RNA polymerase sigma factor n=1 Tax=Sediminibacillus TaxID=482460 RepID=UPI002283FC45|nr:sigma-70 family RNA polymerase sigma factor [Sediminibacillus terrae]